jgi:hypothetical protein
MGDVWRLIVMYPSKLKISYMIKSKREMVEPTVEKFSQMLQQNVGPISRIPPGKLRDG